MWPHCKNGYGLGLGELPKIWEFPFNICTRAEASDFKFCTQLGFTKANHKIPHQRKSGRGLGLEDFLKIFGFSFNICVTAEVSSFKFGMQLGFANAHRKTTPRGKSGRGLGLGKLPNISGSPLIFLQLPHCPLSVSGAYCENYYSLILAFCIA